MTSIGGRQNKEMTSSQMLDSLKNPPTSDDVDSSASEDDDEEQILETGREGRWQKNNQQVPRDVPGIDDAYLAMDTEEGVEVVWNEVIYSQTRRTVKGSKDRLKNILQGLTDVKHQNIVNFYDFWHDKVGSQDRLVFITEYITSGSLKQFLKKTKQTKGTNAVNDKIWRRWCRQILSALSYLHKNDIMHGNLSLASIFIQHNGLVKIGSVSPDAIHQHVKTKNTATTGLHYAAPEYAEGPVKTPADIYAFGMCALEMLNLDLIVVNGEGSQRVQTRDESVQRALDSLDEPKRQFISLCLNHNPFMRPKAHELLKHHVLQEVFNLKLLCAYSLRNHKKEVELKLDKQELNDGSKDKVFAHVPSFKGAPKFYMASQVEKLDFEKFFDEISQDFLWEPSLPIYSPQKKDDPGTMLVPQSSSSSTNRTSNSYDPEERKAVKVVCEVRSLEENKKELCIKLHFKDKMERELRSELRQNDSASDLAMDLVICGLIAEEDREDVIGKIIEKLDEITWNKETIN